MKKIKFILLLLCCILAAGCGDKENGESWQGVTGDMDLTQITERTEYYDIVRESEELFLINPIPADLHTEDQINMKFLGMQFYNEVPVQIWEELHSKDNAYLYSDIYLYMSDGSSSLLLQEADLYRNDPMFHDHHYSAIDYHWFIDQDGSHYYWRRNYMNNETQNASLFVKLDSSGNELYRTGWKYGIDVYDICQLQDGRIYLVLNDWNNDGTQFAFQNGEVNYGHKTLYELNRSTGECTEMEKVELVSNLGAEQFIGAGEQGLIALVKYGNGEILEIDTADGTTFPILSFTGTSYRPGLGLNPSVSLQDIRTLADGSIELLWATPDTDGAKGICERLKMEKVERTPIVLCGIFNDSNQLAEQVTLFNQTNADYHVIIEECGSGSDVEDFARLVSIQIATGGGPDILCGNVLQDYIVGMIEKGTFEDLTPYMEKSGIRKEDYFPIAFSSWQDDGKIYGVNTEMFSLNGISIKKDVLGVQEEPGIEELMDALTVWEGDAVFLKETDSQSLLKEFLQGTEDLWGMVDWETGNCDFSGELFQKIMEVSLRYGEKDMNNNGPYLAARRNFSGLYYYDCHAEQVQSGNVTVGIMFDDGCHAAMSSEKTMAINANSRNKEGAWEFIRFLLGDQMQRLNDNIIPVSKKAFDEWMSAELKQVEDGNIMTIGYFNVVDSDIVIDWKTITREDVTQEWIAEYRKALEEVRTLPIRTVPILDIICEEAMDYFNNIRSIEEVSRSITNRVQLYLDETCR